MDEAQLDVLIDALESSVAWRAGAPAAARDLLGHPHDALTALQRARLTLLGVDEVVRARSPAEAALTIHGVRDQAVRDGRRALRARAEHALSVLFREIGDPSAALEHAVAALDLDADELDPVLRCRLPLAMADALTASGRYDDARGRYAEAIARATDMHLPWMSLHALNNWSYAELLAHDVEAAARLTDRLQTLADQHATPLLLVHVGTVAQVLHARGRSLEAIGLLRERLSDDQPRALIDAAGCWLILADIQRATGALVAAGQSLAVADRLATTHDLPALRVDAVRLDAELCAARGDHVNAYALHRRFHSEALEQRSVARETRTRTLEAVYEVSEARDESTRYREMSHRDPLTSLYNRRYVDDDLDRRLAQGALLAVALVDLDHFKRVNDTCSHEAGDAVLVRIATLLMRAAAGTPDAYAARLGGEEFLLVLPRLDQAAAHGTAESLRREIAGLDWSDLAPDVPVTASIGLAVTPTAGPPSARTDLLRAADRHLYAAKDGGRNRVEPSRPRPDVETPRSSVAVAVSAVDHLADEEAVSGVAAGDHDLVRLMDDLEASYEGRDDSPAARRELLGRLPDTVGFWVQRSRLTLLGVDELIRDHGAGEAARVLVKIRDRATARGHRAVQVGASRSLSWLSRKVGDPSTALEHALAAFALDGDDLDAPLRCRVRLALADALVECGSFDDARPRFRDALARAGRVDTPWLSVLVMNNWAYAELLAGELDASMDLVQQLQAVARQHRVLLDLSTTETAAEVLHALGRSVEAAAMLRKSLDEDRRHAPIVASGCWLTLAQIQREIGDLAAAGHSLDAADRLTRAHAIHVLHVEAMGERAELLAALGDPAGAYDLHRAFHDETLRLRSEAGEARAQTLHAMFEADEARRTSTRYREMSYLDPLTGLFNRRHVDEDLERRLSGPTAPAQPLSIALVDLDHFKRVNDTCSHEAGDAVLTHLADMLKQGADRVPDAYAARLGGEEFLLVLPALDLSEAREVAEALRRQIDAYDWSPLAPGVPVTASVGLASTVGPDLPPPGRTELLRRADRHLYAAKEGGRNRVEPASERAEDPVPDPGRPTHGAFA